MLRSLIAQVPEVIVETKFTLLCPLCWRQYHFLWPVSTRTSGLGSLCCQLQASPAVADTVELIAAADSTHAR